MTHDPMRQGDIERRLSNLAKAPRCGARTRAGHPVDRQQLLVGQGAECMMGQEGRAVRRAGQEITVSSDQASRFRVCDRRPHGLIRLDQVPEGRSEHAIVRRSA